MAFKLKQWLKKELFLLYVIVWFCLLSVHYQKTSLQNHYAVIEKTIQDKMSASSKNGQRPEVLDAAAEADGGGQEDYSQLVDDVSVDILDFDYSDSTVNNTEVLRWFDGREQWSVPLNISKKKHPYIQPYKVSENLCKRKPIHLLIYIQSRPTHGQKRMIIRNTWANTTFYRNISVERIFIIAKDEDVNIMGDVEDEMKRFKDIILADFQDSFRNLSLKGLTLLDFVTKKCQNTKYVLKTDDDIFVNPFMLIEKFISNLSKTQKTVMCHLKEHSKAVVTNKGSKWFIPLELLPNKKPDLPTFCSGFTVLFTADLVPLMLNASHYSPLIPVDDVYIFGFLLRNIPGVTFINTYQHFTLNQKLGLEEYTNNATMLEHVSILAFEESAQKQLWKASLNRLSPLGEKMTYLKKKKIQLKI